MVTNRTASLKHVLAFMGCLFCLKALPILTVTGCVNGTWCNTPNGRIWLTISGGVPPYTALWSNGATTTSGIAGLGAGGYSVTVTDAASTQQTANFTVNVVPIYIEAGNFGNGPPGWEYPPGYLTTPAPVSLFCDDGVCPGMCYDAYPQGFPEWAQSPGFVHHRTPLGNSPPGYHVYPALFNVGCSGSLSFSTGYLIDWPELSVLNVFPQCGTSATGAIIGYTGAEGHNQAVQYGLYRIPDGTQMAFGTVSGFGGPFTINNVAAGSYWLRLQLYGADATAPAGPEAMVTVPSDPNCRTLTGYAYLDANKDCVKQGAEPLLPGIALVVTPGPYYTSTDNNGNYRFNLPQGGTYSVTETAANVNQFCPAPGTTVTLTNNTVQNLGDTSIMGMDVRASIVSGPARPGFQFSYSASVQNNSYTSSGTYSFTVAYDPLLTYISATPAPSVVAAGVLTWNGQAALAAFASRGYAINLQVPADVGLLGTVLAATANVTLLGTDVDPANNTASTQTTITGSFDPNDKLARTSSGASATQFLLGQDEWIDYTIRFQNTGTDTAFTVIVTDTLPASLDPSTLEWGAISHTNMRWTAGQVIRVAFPAINLPHSAVNEPGSHGKFTFRIRPRSPVVPGTVITNRANIYFDFNPPIITDPAVLTVANPGVLLQARVFLGGPYVEATQLMNDDLRAQGRVPLFEPYTALGFPALGSGGELTIPAVLSITGNNAIIDWVLLELRNAATPSQIVTTRRALLQRDGDVVDVDGTSPVRLNAANGSYRIAIRHRNHLGAMTNNAYSLNGTPSPVDFTLASEATYGGAGARKIIGTKAVLWSGNVTGDNKVKYVGAGNDRDPILSRIGGSVPTAMATGYWREDVDMSGTVKYAGTANDRDPILVNIGGTVPTAVLIQQLP